MLISYQTSDRAYISRGDVVEVFKKRPNGEIVDFPDVPTDAYVYPASSKNDLKKLAEELEDAN